MKKIFFLFAMLASVTASAQNVKVESISATYTGTPAVKFRVSWTGVRSYRHNTKVWVFVDYRKIENNAPVGSWTRALVAATPVVNSTPASSAMLESGNDKGFWLLGANGDYSATVTVPVTLAAGVTQFNWCAYASDFPPNAEITKGTVTHGTYTLHGTPPFIIDGTYTTSAQSYTGTLITSIIDETDCPGIITAPQYASTYTGCNVWVELVDVTVSTMYGSITDAVCTNRYGTGWRVPAPAEMVCICNNRSKLENPINTVFDVTTQTNHFVYWVNTAQRLNYNDGTNCTLGNCAGCGAYIRCVRSM